MLRFAKLVGVFDVGNLWHQHEPRIGRVVYHEEERYRERPDDDGVGCELGVEGESHGMEFKKKSRDIQSDLF